MIDGQIMIADVLMADRIVFWPFALTLILVTASLYIRAVNITNWNLLFRSTISSRATAQLMREEKVMESTLVGILVFIFFLSISLFVYNLQVYSGFPFLFSTYPFVSYTSVVLILAGIYVVKVGFLYLIQLIFQQRDLFNEYIIILMNINIVTGIFMIPLNLVFQYGLYFSKSYILLISIALAVVSVLLRYVRIFELGRRSKMNWYNIILYLCTLEILPVIIIMTIVMNIGVSLNFGI